MECIKFPSIDQFKHAIKQVESIARYRGKDDEGNVIIDRNATLPKLFFTATVKLHGTNASIRLTSSGEYLAQSRERVLSLTQDNAGFFVYANQHKEFFEGILNEYLKDNDEVIVYGEWAGKGIQKGVGISELDKAFYIFALRTMKDGVDAWHNVSMIPVTDELHSHSAYIITEFPSFVFLIDFEAPQESQNQLVDLCMKVENECPVAKHFGVSGIGEGIVLTHNSEEFGRIVFKIKGEKHSNSKVKTLAPVDEESFKAAKEFAQNFVTESRLEQGIHVLTNERLIDMTDNKNIGEFIKWVCGDVIREEQQNIVENGLDVKKISKEIQNIARKWFLSRSE